MEAGNDLESIVHCTLAIPFHIHPRSDINSLSIMSCPQNQITRMAPSTCFLFEAANAGHAMQAWLGIPDSLGLFSSSELPFCQLVEMCLLILAHGILSVWFPFGPFLIREKSKTPHANKLAWAVTLVTGVIWIQMPYVSPTSLYSSRHN